MEVDKGKHFKGDFKSYERARYNLVNKLIEIYKITNNILSSQCSVKFNLKKNVYI